jgi:hypothetical protein
LIERWSVPEAFDGIAVIGADEEGDGLRRHYFDARGERRIYQMTIDGGLWKQWRDGDDPFPQRFTGTFNGDRSRITGHWEKAPDGRHWEPDIDIAYHKVTSP